MADAQATVDFLYAHRDCIHSAAIGTFMLERHAPVWRSPEEFGVSDVTAGEGGDLAITFDYRVSAGMDATLAEMAVSRLMDALPTKEYPQWYVHDTYRLLYASRLRDASQPYPTWLGSGEGAAR